MTISRRRSITNDLVTQFKKINGQRSTFLNTFIYNINLYNNVYRRIKFIDEVNDFPAIYLQAGEEFRIYESDNFTTAQLPITVRYYVKSPTPREDIDNLTQDLEHVINNLPLNTNLDITDITIDSISYDEGLIAPLGIGELFLTVKYELDR